MEDEESKKGTMELIAQFTSFLEDFGNATDDQQRAFLDFLTPQSRADLLHLADALHRKIELVNLENEDAG